MVDSNRSFTGFLYRLDEDESMLELLRALQVIRDWVVLIENAWFEFEWSSHRFILREGKDRFLLLSQEQSNVPMLLDALGLSSRLRRPRIMVADFVISNVPPMNAPHAEFSRQYRISNIFASVDGYGRSLQTLALWGDDMLNSEMFLGLLSQVKPYRVTVRDPVRNTDIVSVGSTGGVNFYFGALMQLRRVDGFLRYLKRANHIRWEPDAASASAEDLSDDSR